MRAAGNWLAVECHLVVPVFTTGGSQKQDQLNPYLSEILSQRRAWRQPKEKKVPISGAMFETMQHIAWNAASSKPTAIPNSSREEVLFDFTVLATFTGSRLAEYGQAPQPSNDADITSQHGTASRPTRQEYWHTIPNNRDVPAEWRGMPLAFMASDFELFDKQSIRLTHAEALREPSLVHYVEVRFRYDKSFKNFTKRRFKRTFHAICLVAAVLRILSRAYNGLMDIKSQPLGFFLDQHGRRTSIKGRHMQDFLQQACQTAHPNPNHYLRLHVKQLMAHCCRVAACVFLKLAGYNEDDIAWRLRWNSQAVRDYLRDCFHAVGREYASIFASAYLGNDNLPTGST